MKIAKNSFRAGLLGAAAIAVLGLATGSAANAAVILTIDDYSDVTE